MELRHFRYFAAVAEELSFSRAARRLHVSQPPLTQAIQLLERELGSRLFDRTSRRVALTEAGNAFLARARSILTQVDRCASELRLAEAGKKEVLRVGFSRSDVMLPSAIKSFRRRFPDVHLELFSSLGRPHRALLLDGEADLNIGEYFPADVQFNSRFWVEAGLIAVVPASHRLAGRARIGIRELRDEPLLLPGPQHSPLVAREALRLCRQDGGFEPRLLQQWDNVEVLLALVASEAGMGLCHSFVRWHPTSGVVCVPLREKTETVKGGVVWRRDREGPALLALVQELEDQVRRVLRPYASNQPGGPLFARHLLGSRKLTK